MNLRSMIAIPVFGVILGGLPLQAQITVQDFQETEGPWECTDAGGVQGIFISGSTRLKEVEGQQKVAWQNVDILVYSHRASEQKMGYFAPGHEDSTASIRFDGKNLAIHFSGKPTIASPPHLAAFDLDLTFDRATKQWNGAWSMCDKAGGATLERPHPGNNVQSGFLAGDWEGIADSRGSSSFVSNSLHIRQGTDKASVWFDLVQRLSLSEMDHIAAEGSVVSAGDRNFVLWVTYGGGGQFRYEGSVSPDGQRMSGRWYNESTTGIVGISVTGEPVPREPPGFAILYQRRD